MAPRYNNSPTTALHGATALSSGVGYQEHFLLSYSHFLPFDPLKVKSLFPRQGSYKYQIKLSEKENSVDVSSVSNITKSRETRRQKNVNVLSTQGGEYFIISDSGKSRANL